MIVQLITIKKDCSSDILCEYETDLENVLIDLKNVLVDLLYACSKSKRTVDLFKQSLQYINKEVDAINLYNSYNFYCTNNTATQINMMKKDSKHIFINPYHV